KLLDVRLHYVRMGKLVVPVAKGRVQENRVVYQLHQPVPLMWLEEGEEDMAVLAAIIAVRRLWIAGAGPAQDVFSIGVAHQAVIDLCQHLLRRYLDYLATPAASPLPESAERAEGRVQAGQMHPLFVG